MYLHINPYALSCPNLVKSYNNIHFFQVTLSY